MGVMRIGTVRAGVIAMVLPLPTSPTIRARRSARAGGSQALLAVPTRVPEHALKRVIALRAVLPVGRWTTAGRICGFDDSIIKYSQLIIMCCHIITGRGRTSEKDIIIL